MELDECKAFTSEAESGLCWLKNKINGDSKASKTGLISANKECFIRCPANQYKVGHECEHCPKYMVSLEGSTSRKNCTGGKLKLVNL